MKSFQKSERGRAINRRAKKKYYLKIRGATKACSRCGDVRELSDFTHKKGENRYGSRCSACRHVAYIEGREQAIRRAKIHYDTNRDSILAKEKEFRRANIGKHLLMGAKARAKERGLKFDLSPEDIVVPLHCPALGIPLIVGNGKSHAASPTLDRIKSELGYVRGNVIVVSKKANTIKTDATVEELCKVAEFYRSITYYDQTNLDAS